MKLSQFVKNFVILITALAPLTSMAVSEVNYPQTMESEIKPFMEQHGRYETLPVTKGMTLSTFSVFGPGPKGDIILVPGQGEFVPKYYETAYDFIQMGYSAVHIIDHRGQGTSPRILPAEPRKGSVEKFDDYVNDLEIFVKSVRAKRPGRKIFLVAQSMGGCITTLFLKKTEQEKLLDKVVLSAPMLGIRAPFVGDSRLLKPLMLALCATKKSCDNYALGQDHFNEYIDFKGNIFTNSQIRWEMAQSMLQEDPKLGINGPTTRWVLESTRAIERIARISPPKNTPVLLFQATADKVVMLRPQTKYCAKSESCNLVKVPGSMHEIFQEQDYIRKPFLSQIDHFLSQ